MIKPFVHFKADFILSKSLLTTREAFYSFISFLYTADKVLFRLLNKIEYYEKFYIEKYEFALEVFGKTVENNPFKMYFLSDI